MPHGDEKKENQNLDLWIKFSVSSSKYAFWNNLWNKVVNKKKKG